MLLPHVLQESCSLDEPSQGWFYMGRIRRGRLDSFQERFPNEARQAGDSTLMPPGVGAHTLVPQGGLQPLDSLCANISESLFGLLQSWRLGASRLDGQSTWKAVPGAPLRALFESKLCDSHNPLAAARLRAFVPLAFRRYTSAGGRHTELRSDGLPVRRLVGGCS